MDDFVNCFFVLYFFHMLGLLLTSQPLVRIFFIEPSVILFGVLLMLMSASCALVFVVHKQKEILLFFLGLQCLVLMALIGIVSFDLIGNVGQVFSAVGDQFLSELFSTHRWILMQVPILLTSVALMLGWVCRNDLKEKHTREYILAMRVCVVVSFLTILVIGIESLI